MIGFIWLMIGYNAGLLIIRRYCIWLNKILENALRHAENLTSTRTGAV
jgi:hypothetical protein